MLETLNRTQQLLWRALAHRQRAYKNAFEDSTFGREVLQDLARFCRAHETTFCKNDREHAVLEGRREVFLRIAHHLKLDMDDLWALLNEGPVKNG